MSKRLTTNEIAFAIAVETTEAIHTAQALVKDAEIAARAKHTAAQHTNCRNCQAALENFLIEFPYCRAEAIEEKHQGSLGSLPELPSRVCRILGQVNERLPRNA